jgi:hypothetical protein
MAPCSTDDNQVLTAFHRFARSFAFDGHVRLQVDVSDSGLDSLDIAAVLSSSSGTKSKSTWFPKTEEECLAVESAHKICDLYLWLGNRFPASFPEIDEAVRQSSEASRLLNLYLESGGRGGRVPKVRSGQEHEEEEEDEDENEDEEEGDEGQRRGHSTEKSMPRQRQRQRRAKRRRN